MTDIDRIEGWHAHVYFTKTEVGRARALCEAARDQFGIDIGRMHQGPVGPHPMGSCQLTVPPVAFAEVIAWLALNRDGLTVFAHAETGDAWADHTQHVVWLGESKTLRLEVLRELLDR